MPVSWGHNNEISITGVEWCVGRTLGHKVRVRTHSLSCAVINHIVHTCLHNSLHVKVQIAYLAIYGTFLPKCPKTLEFNMNQCTTQSPLNLHLLQTSQFLLKVHLPSQPCQQLGVTFKSPNLLLLLPPNSINYQLLPLLPQNTSLLSLPCISTTSELVPPTEIPRIRMTASSVLSL